VKDERRNRAHREIEFGRFGAPLGMTSFGHEVQLADAVDEVRPASGDRLDQGPSARGRTDANASSAKSGCLRCKEGRIAPRTVIVQTEPPSEALVAVLLNREVLTQT